MDEKDKQDPSQIHDVVFDPDLPLKPPRELPLENPDHGPDYDPDTIDLFDPVASAEEALRLGAEQVINDLVHEFSEEITQRLRAELTDQLKSILDDLNHPTDKS
ncbi:MAG TPA: hypothetical protein DCM54_00885 [Gammaproteobacteria bacterium]|nr:hypothetical protein [Gammaproteobacteria bacterium]|tara:strand:- start:1378 stop:1689 length:312 start_codon:yes stop_codon:yes gene_type:complete